MYRGLMGGWMSFHVSRPHIIQKKEDSRSDQFGWKCTRIQKGLLAFVIFTCRRLRKGKLIDRTYVPPNKNQTQQHNTHRTGSRAPLSHERQLQTWKSGSFLIGRTSFGSTIPSSRVVYFKSSLGAHAKMRDCCASTSLHREIYPK